MEPNFPAIVNLLHRCEEAALATLSTVQLGFPFATVADYVTDEHHRPVFLLETSGQEARDLTQDNRSSLVVHRRNADGMIERVVLVGAVQPIDAEPLLVERFRRYHPDGAGLLQGSGYRFCRFQAVQLYYVSRGMPGRWLPMDAFQGLPWLPLAFERDVIKSLQLPENVSVLGVDCFGIDLLVVRARQRFSFAQPIVVAGKARAVAQELLDRLRH